MPAINPDGSLNLSDTQFGCDARGLTFEGALCPEFTLFEGNMYGFRTTPRACDAPTEKGYFSTCDAEGDLAVDVKDQTDFTYGPNMDIDTNRTMTIRVDFHADDTGNTLVGYDVTISQEATGKSFTISKSGDYLAMLSPYLQQGMAIQVSNLAFEPSEAEHITHDVCDK